MLSFISFLVVPLGILNVCAKTAQDWGQLSIYQLITDRFATADGSSPRCEDLRSYCGGSWKGIEKKLDYIQGMGFEAVWISPVYDFLHHIGSLFVSNNIIVAPQFRLSSVCLMRCSIFGSKTGSPANSKSRVRNIEGSTPSGYAYHGYWVTDPFSLNQHFGTADDLKSLSDAIHARNMSLMLDVVINFLTSNSEASVVNYNQYPAPFNTTSAFHPACTIDYKNQNSVENCWLIVAPPPSLPDINTENTNVLNSIIQSVVDIVNKYSVDGIRLDTTKHLPKPALAAFQSAVQVFVTGEAYDGSVPYVASYQGNGGLESMVNYPMFWPMIPAFNGSGSFGSLANIIRSELSTFSNPNVLANFLDNPDQPRFASVSPGIIYDQNAVAFQMLHSGIPVTYYGFEQRFTGSGDPDNRGGLWYSNYDTTAPLYTFISKLHQIRNVVKVNDQGFFSGNSNISSVTDHYMVVERGPVVLVVNNLGAGDNGYQVPTSQLGENVGLIDLISCDRTTTGSGGGITSAGKGGVPRVWIRQDVQRGGLCN